MKNLFASTFLLGLSIFPSGEMFSQTSTLDSLIGKIQIESDPIKKTELLYALGDHHQNIDSSLFYYRKARDYAIQENYPLGQAKYASHAIEILNRQGKFKEALELSLQAVELYKLLPSRRNLSIAYLNVGSQWEYFSDYHTAAEYYLKAKKIAETLEDKTTLRTINNNLGSVFINLGQLQKGMSYAKKALQLAEELNNQNSMLSPLYNLAEAANELGNTPQALEYITRFENLAIDSDDAYDIADAKLSKGKILGKKDFKKAISLINEGLFLAQANNFQHLESTAYLYLTEINVIHKQYTDALSSAEKGIQLAKELELKKELAELYRMSSIAYENKNEFKEALEFRHKYEKINQEIALEQHRNTITALEIKYNFEQKEALIASLEKEKLAQNLVVRQKNTLNIILIGSLFLILIIGLLLYRNYQNQKKIHQEKISTLEAERQLLASHALLQGQEEERSRMAKDLHDGLGGLLSGVKINLSHMKRNIIISEEEGKVFEKSVFLLDESIKELRRVAHNLMPETIIKLGLDGAIHEFLESINSENIKIIYQSYNIENGINKPLDIATYRIVQELMNNVLKHANASEVLVQVRKDDALLMIDVEDNGSGLDLLGLSDATGMGLAGIKSRVHYWKGDIETDSNLGEGTAIHIQIPISDV